MTDGSRRQTKRGEPVLRAPDPELARTSTRAALGARRARPADAADHRDAGAGPSSSRRSRSRRSASGRGAAGTRLRRGQGLSTAGAAVRPDLDHQRGAAARGPAGEPAQPERLAGHAGDGAPPPALAAPRVQQRPPVLLPGRGGRDGHLADRGRAAVGKAGKRFLDHLANANNDANPELMRLALKLATGAGKTTVMAMLIAWQTSTPCAARAASTSRAASSSSRPA